MGQTGRENEGTLKKKGESQVMKTGMGTKREEMQRWSNRKEQSGTEGGVKDK